MSALFGVVAALVLGVVANDLWTLSSGIAHRIVIVAARLWSSERRQAQVLAEEWQAYLNDRPGQILKLLTALGLLTAAIGRMLARKLMRAPGRISLSFHVPSLLPAVDRAAGEDNGVLVWLLSGIIASIAPLALLLVDVDMTWSYLGWGLGLAVAASTALTSVVLGFLVRPADTRDPDLASLNALAEAFRTEEVVAAPPRPRTSAPLVRPYVARPWEGERGALPSTRLVRPYVGLRQVLVEDEEVTGRGE